MADKEWHYLGDGVYIKNDGYGLWLHANSHDEPTDRVYLEWPVLQRMIDLLGIELKGKP